MTNLSIMIALVAALFYGAATLREPTPTPSGGINPVQHSE